MKMELHQESTLSLLPFALVMDALPQYIQDEKPWCLLFADDIKLIGETHSEVNDRSEIWRQLCKLKGLS